MMDPPAHDRLRALVSRVFTPRAVQSLEPLVRRVIGRCVDALDGREEFDAIAELAALFPVEIIAEMLGVPEPDRQQIRHWVDVALTREVGDMHVTPAGARAFMDIHVYFHELAVDKRAEPGEDLTSRLTEARVDRGDGELTGLDDDEIAGFASLLGSAGAETVTKL